MSLYLMIYLDLTSTIFTIQRLGTTFLHQTSSLSGCMTMMGGKKCKNSGERRHSRGEDESNAKQSEHAETVPQKQP